ncbi:MAG: XdhC family protein [Lachnospiraceae bacterium]|nr:XdhC family protein [Candidatus Equihabitans merdae]
MNEERLKELLEEDQGYRLYICGGGHVANYVLRLGKMLDFHVIVFEDRPFFAEKAREAGADEVRTGDYVSMLSSVRGTPHSAFIIASKGPETDTICLGECLAKEYFYIGMLGSRRKSENTFEVLRKKGISDSLLSRVHTPIGLTIHAESPAEIAVAIMGEIIQEKAGIKEDFDLTNQIKEALSREGTKLLFTILETEGSVPRKKGTRMVLNDAGEVYGTIGGGVTEYKMIQKGELLIKDKRFVSGIKDVDIELPGDDPDAPYKVSGKIKLLIEKFRT